MPTIVGRKVHPLTAILLALLVLIFLVILIPLAILFALIFFITRTLRALFSPATPRAVNPSPPDEGRRNVRVIQSPPPTVE